VHSDVHEYPGEGYSVASGILAAARRWSSMALQVLKTAQYELSRARYHQRSGYDALSSMVMLPPGVVVVVT